MLANPPRTSTTVPQGVRVPLGEEASDLGIEWDANNRLVAVKEGPNTLASFTYNASGRRVTKAAGGVTTTFVYDVAQFLEERPSTGPTKRYVYGPGIDQPLVQSVTGVVSYYVADHLGSVVRLTDAGGAPTLTREYDPWGNLLQGSAANGYAYTGREWDPETGLHYYRARYYHPKIARFINEDPIGFSGGVNVFEYASNAPIRLTDPLGLKAPEYDPGRWNSGGYVITNNCYSYAWDKRFPSGPPAHAPQPGEAFGRRLSLPLTCSQITSFARQDGFREAKKQKGTDCCDSGYHLVKLYIGQHVSPPGGPPVDLGQDYHWIRQDSNGRWSSKHGLTAVGPQVDDPDADAKAWGYTTKCGAMCAPDRR